MLTDVSALSTDPFSSTTITVFLAQLLLLVLWQTTSVSELGEDERERSRSRSRSSSEALLLPVKPKVEAVSKPIPTPTPTPTQPLPIKSSGPNEIMNGNGQQRAKAEQALQALNFTELVENEKSPVVPSINPETLEIMGSELPKTISLTAATVENEQALADVSAYVTQFLAKSHPLVGRPGPVCPFVPIALKSNLVRLVAVNTTPDVTIEDIATLTLRVKAMFKEMQPKEGRLVVYKAIIMVFPDLVTDEQRKLVDLVQEALKEFFVEDHMMLGEFHRQNNSSGLRNDKFYPLRTPHPCLAMRHMVPSDIAFLTPAKYAPEKVTRFLTHFISAFESSGSSQVDEAREVLRQHMASLTSAANSHME